MKIRLFLLSGLFLALSYSMVTAQVIAAWNFNNITPGNIETATPSTGQGSLMLVGDITSPETGSAGSPNDGASPNLAFQTTGYPVQGEGNKSSGVQFNVSTVGFFGVQMNAEIRTSNTASRWVQVQYTVDGTNFVDFDLPLRLGGLGENNAGDNWHPISVDFSNIPDVNNNPNFAVRLVSAFSPIPFTMFNNSTDYGANQAYESARNVSQGANSNYGGGTWRFDLVNFVSGTVPTLNVVVTGSMAFSQNLGAPSAPQTIQVSGSNLEETVSVSVGAPFEVSLASGEGYGAMVELPLTAGSLASTTVFVRMNSSTEGTFESVLEVVSGSESFSTAVSGSVAVLSLSLPEAHSLFTGDYQFTEWSAESPAGTFPSNMVFWTHAVTDPVLSTPFAEDYTCLYNNTQRSRIVGEGEQGVSFLNTGNAQFVGVCDGSDPGQTMGATIANGRSGAAVLALNTLETYNIIVNWTGRTIAPNSRVYGLRLQYRISGVPNLNEAWQDLPTVSEYITNEAGHEQTLSVTLPAECEDRSYVLLRWVYYYLEGSGARAHLNLDDIIITADRIVSTRERQATAIKIFPNPVQVGSPLFLEKAMSGQIIDVHGRTVMQFAQANQIATSGLKPGIYIMHTEDGISRIVVQ